jgi:hypothetical protein
MALHTYDESKSSLQSLLQTDPNHAKIVNYLAANSLPGHLVPTEFAIGASGATTDVRDAGGHDPMILIDDEANGSLDPSTWPALKFVIEASNESLTTADYKQGMEFDLLGHDTLSAGSTTGDSIWSGGSDDIWMGAAETLTSASGGDTIHAGAGSDTISASGANVYVPAFGNDVISGSGNNIFADHFSSTASFTNLPKGAVQVSFSDTGQTLLFEGGTSTIFFSDGHPGKV